MPGWLAGLKGDIGVGGLSPVHVDVPFSKILEHLDMVAALTVEAQHGPWSLFGDGLYMRVSAGGATPGPLLNSIEATQNQVLAEAGVAYRLWEGKRGYFDVLAGARYIYVDARVNLNISSSGVESVSNQLSSAVVNQVTSAVQQKASEAQSEVSARIAQATSNLATATDAIKTGVRDKIISDATGIIQDKIAGVIEKYPHLPDLIGGSGPVSDAIRQLVDAKVSAAAAELNAKAEAAREQAQTAVSAAEAALRSRLQSAISQAKAKANSAVQKAQQNLASKISSAIRQAIPQEVSGSRGWVDPFVGFHGRYNFTDHVYATVRADIGGFGVSSKLDWQAYGALGWQFNRIGPANWVTAICRSTMTRTASSTMWRSPEPMWASPTSSDETADTARESFCPYRPLGVGVALCRLFRHHSRGRRTGGIEQRRGFHPPPTRYDFRYQYEDKAGGVDQSNYILRRDVTWQLNDEWQLTTRLDVPFISSDEKGSNNPARTLFGLGDILAQVAIIDSPTDRFAWGGGARGHYEDYDAPNQKWPKPT